MIPQPTRRLQDQILEGPSFRITLISERIVRFEYSRRQAWVNNPTTRIRSRLYADPIEFHTTREGNTFCVSTKYFKLSYVLYERPSHLSLLITSNETKRSWRYGDEEILGVDKLTHTIHDEILKSSLFFSPRGITVYDDAYSAEEENSNPLPKKDFNRTDLYFFVFGQEYRLGFYELFRLFGPTKPVIEEDLQSWNVVSEPPHVKSTLACLDAIKQAIFAPLLTINPLIALQWFTKDHPTLSNFLSLRAKLAPWYCLLFNQAMSQGEPILTPFSYAHPGCRYHGFYLGDQTLAIFNKPQRIDEGAGLCKTMIRGFDQHYYHYFTYQKLPKRKTLPYYYGLEDYPVFVRAGSIVFSEEESALHFRVFLGGPGKLLVPDRFDIEYLQSGKKHATLIIRNLPSSIPILFEIPNVKATIQLRASDSRVTSFTVSDNILSIPIQWKQKKRSLYIRIYHPNGLEESLSRYHVMRHITRYLEYYYEREEIASIRNTLLCAADGGKKVMQESMKELDILRLHKRVILDLLKQVVD